MKASEKVGVRYMQAWEERYYDWEEGKLEGKLEAAINMRKEGLSDELILRVTKLTKEELEKINE